MRLLLATVLLGAIGLCARAPAPKTEPPPPPEPTDPESRIKKVVRQSYEALTLGEPERLADLVTDDVVAVGLGPQEYVTDKDALIEEVRRQLLPIGLRGETLRVARSRPKVGLAEGGQSAWVWDFPRFVRERKERRPTTWLPRVTLHLVKQTGLWKVDALHVSFGHPDADLYAPGAEKQLIAPADPGVDKGTGSEQAVGLARRLLDDIAVKVDRVSDQDRVLLLGTDPNDVFEGGKAFKDLARPRLPELKKAPFSLKLYGGPRARLGPGGKTAWVLATVQLTLYSGTGKAKKAQPLVPFRTFWVFAEEDGLWNLVLEHQSLGLLPEQRKAARAEDLKEDPEDSADAGTSDAGGSPPGGPTADGGRSPAPADAGAGGFVPFD